MRPAFVVVAAVIAVSPLNAQDEQPARWPVLSRVRVWTDTVTKVVGQLIDVRNDTLIIDDSRGSSRRPYVRIPARSTIRIEVSDGRHVSARNMARGTLIGAGAGLIGTALFVDIIWAEFCPVDCGDPQPNYRRATLIGAGLGALLGAARRVDHWSELPFPSRLMIAPSARGATIGFSLAF